MAVNASPRELRDEDYVERVSTTLARHSLPPDQLMIEVTESAMHESGRPRAMLDALHRLGVLIAIDDFGTEQSSLSRLRELPVQVLKVDRSFLCDVPADPKAGAIVQAISTLGVGLGMDVVAEGIETAAQQAFAHRAGCRYGQGYYLARPGPADQLGPQLTSWRAPQPRADRALGLSPAGSRRRSPAGTT
jgi:EAL domain-containing protein (putative c-di-GMP-specific phosphodiesterase class I)